MKKLYKNTKAVENSLKAYACTMKCACDAANCYGTNYRADLSATTMVVAYA